MVDDRRIGWGRRTTDPVSMCGSREWYAERVNRASELMSQGGNARELGKAIIRSLPKKLRP